MVSESTLQASYTDAFVIDAGCACGTILKGFKSVMGVDLSEYMVKMGRAHFGYSERELVISSITDIPVESETASLVHSHHVLEHIPAELIDSILDEFVRVLRPGGRAFICLPAVRHGESKDKYMGDPTHVNIKPLSYWDEKFHSKGLVFDLEAYCRFVRSRRGPTAGDPRSFFERHIGWNVWTLRRVSG